MACADALVAPRPNEPTIAKPAIESLLALAVILQLLCCLLRSSNEPNSLHGGSRFPAVPVKFLDRHFLVTVSPSGQPECRRARCRVPLGRSSFAWKQQSAHPCEHDDEEAADECGRRL